MPLISGTPFLESVMNEPRRLSVSQRGSVTTIRFLDVRLINAEIIVEVSDELLAFVTTRRPAKLIVDFGEVVRLGTEAINAMIRVRHALLDYGGELRLCGMSSSIREAFSILRLDEKVFKILASPDDALTSLE